MRRILLVSVLVLAAGCHPEAEAPVDLPAAAPEVAVPLSTTDSTGFALRPAGSAEILAYVRDSPARVKVVNFWATWCVPCREEFPDLVRVGNDFRDQGLEMIFVSADFPEEEPAVLAFLREHGVEGVSFLKNESDDDAFISAFDPEWMGELPATIVYDASDAKTHVWHGATTYNAVVTQVAPLLNNP